MPAILRVAIARIRDEPGAGCDAAPGWMSEAERRRWAALATMSRREFTASRALLRTLLQEATGLAAEAWDVSAEVGMAPMARTVHRDDGAGAPRVSLSHRLGWVAAAVGDTPVGIDLECRRPTRSDPSERAALMLSPAELPPWQALGYGDRESALLTRWVAKEAWFKASPPETALWDFRRVAAHACAPEHANVRVWESPSLHLALCCADAQALDAVRCEGLDVTATRSSSWYVHRVSSAT